MKNIISLVTSFLNSRFFFQKCDDKSTAGQKVFVKQKILHWVTGCSICYPFRCLVEMFSLCSLWLNTKWIAFLLFSFFLLPMKVSNLKFSFGLYKRLFLSNTSLEKLRSFKQHGDAWWFVKINGTRAVQTLFSLYQLCRIITIGSPDPTIWSNTVHLSWNDDYGCSSYVCQQLVNQVSYSTCAFVKVWPTVQPVRRGVLYIIPPGSQQVTTILCTVPVAAQWL